MFQTPEHYALSPEQNVEIQTDNMHMKMRIWRLYVISTRDIKWKLKVNNPMFLTFATVDKGLSMCLKFLYP